MHQYATWYGGRSQPMDFVVNGDPAPPQKGGGAPIFGQCLLRPNGWVDQDALGTEVGLGPDDTFLDGDTAPLPKRGQSPLANFWPVYCGQMAGWIEMALGLEVSLGPGHTVLDGDPAPIPKNGLEPPPNFRPIFIVAKRLDASKCHLVWR